MKKRHLLLLCWSRGIQSYLNGGHLADIFMEEWNKHSDLCEDVQQALKKDEGVVFISSGLGLLF